MNDIKNYEKIVENFIDEIVEIRKKKGITQEELARRIGTKKSNISRIENKRQLNLTFDMMAKLTNALDESIFISIDGNNVIKLDHETMEKLHYINEKLEKTDPEVLHELILREYQNLAEGVTLSFSHIFNNPEVYDSNVFDTPELYIGG